MALTAELIKANESLSALTDEQIKAITELSTNDENRVIGTRIGEIYREMDAKIADITGVQRDGAEKTYIYLERSMKSVKEKADSVSGLNKTISELTAEKERLEKVIADGSGDSETKQKLEQANKDLASVKKQYADLKSEYDTAKQKHADELFGIKVDNEISSARSGLTLKKELSEAVRGVLMEQAIAKVKGMHPEYRDNGKGGKQLVFIGADGAVMTNPQNALNPYTAAELLAKELKELGVLEDGRGGSGGGTKPGASAGADGVIIVTGCKTQTEAYDAIAKALAEEGLTIYDAEYDKRMRASWEANKVKELPSK